MDNVSSITLADGLSLPCLSSLSEKIVEGELVFTTVYPGYTQSLTDPSYCGQILIFAFPCIGIYGVDEEDFQSHRPWVEAVVVQSLDDLDGSVRNWLDSWKIPIITGVDCRNLILHLRESGTLMARISPETESPLADCVSDDLISVVSSESVETIGDGDVSVALIDYGVKGHIVKNLVDRGCRVVLFPYDSTSEDILSSNPDGVLLSNGPGDPSVLYDQVKVVKELSGRLPVFGICLGCQILSQACGAVTEKLSYGHRGGNQPVMDISRGRAIVTSQNHGYAVAESSIPGTGLEVTFRHLGDGTVEGVSHNDMALWGVQFHPEAGSGPLDALYLFDDFISRMKEAKANG